MMLLQQLRDSRWRIAQVELVGAVECPSPSPIRVLGICGRYEVTDRELEAALRLLGPEVTRTVRKCLSRNSTWEREGTKYVECKPTFQPFETACFDQLWATLAEQGWLRRIA